MMAGEGIVAAVAYRFKKKFSVLKIYNNVILIIKAAALALIFTRQLTGDREGTLLTALLTGKFIELIERFFRGCWLGPSITSRSGADKASLLLKYYIWYLYFT